MSKKLTYMAKTDGFYIWPHRDDEHTAYVSPVTDAQTFHTVEFGELCTCNLSHNCAHVQAVRTAVEEVQDELTAEEYREISMRERKVLVMEIEEAIEQLMKTIT